MTGMKPLSFPQGVNSPEEKKSHFPFASTPPAQPDQPPAPRPVDSATRMKQLEVMLQEAQGRAEIVEKEAYDKAYLAGEKAGMALGKKRAEQILESLEVSLQDVEGSLTSIEQAFAEAAMDIARHIAEKIIGSAIEQDQAKLLQIALHAAAQLPDTSALRIAVSSDDYASFKRLLDESESIAILTADDSTASGSCRIVSEQQDILIDPIAAVAIYMEQLTPAMLNEMSQRSEKNIQRPEDDDTIVD
ncbi:MAG: flagellar assembly protein [Zetaproteobacteria bacterium CG1_02_53_45]|nr:MAG: flagellar assembly protein [Zetaproteobacteria bacterium CG1_02_53_45]